MTTRVRTIAIALAATCVLFVGATTAVGVPSRTRTFTGTGILAEYYTAQTVTGMFNGWKPLPLNVTVQDWQGTVLVTAPAPRLHRAFWGGYWKQTYHLNAWYLGKGNATRYHLLLPDTPVGGTFTGLLISEFDAGGNWQNWIDFTVTVR